MLAEHTSIARSPSAQTKAQALSKQKSLWKLKERLVLSSIEWNFSGQ